MIYRAVILPDKQRKPAPAPEVLHRFVLSGTWGADAKITCWCGKSHYLSKLGWRVMFRGINHFLAEHEQCQPMEQA